MVYFIAGDSYSDLSAIRNAGIVDVHLVIHGGGVAPPQQFVTDCNNAKVSPICNCGNDGANGDGGDPQYYTRMAAMGYHAGGGESEKADEMDRCMDNIIFLNYGGEGLNPEDDVFSGVHPAAVHDKGCASYMETYDSGSNFWGWNVVGSAMLNAKAHGVKEIGICVGSWMISHSTAQDYIQLAQDMEAHGITCAGIGVWSGYGNNMNTLLNEFASWYKAWQAVWPPETRTMKERFAGPTPPPPVTKKPTTIGVTSDKRCVGVNKPVTFTVTLKDGNTPIPREVTFYHTLNGVRYNDKTAFSTLTVPVSFTSPGIRYYYASFAGDENYLGSTSAVLPICVCSEIQ